MLNGSEKETLSDPPVVSKLVPGGGDREVKEPGNKAVL